MATTRPNSAEEVKNIPYAARSLFRKNPLSIGRRLTVCFLLIVVSMIAEGAVVFWQFRQMVVPSRRLSNADQTSLALARLHLDVDTFRENVAALESGHDTEQFSTEAAGLRQSFLRDVENAQQALDKAPEIAREDPTIAAALETLKVTLPSQLDTAVQLAATGDWNAVRLRLEHQIQDLIDLSSSLVAKVDRQAQQQRTKAIEDAETARQGLLVVLLVAGLLTLILAAALGWYATQSITVPLSELASGAQALARGDLSHQVSVYGNDELAVVGRAFNHATRQLQQLYEELREQASLLSLTHDAIYVRDVKEVIRYWNQGAEELYGWPAEYALGKVAHELLKTVSPLPLEQIEAELLRTGRWEGELLKTKKDGTQLVVSSRWSLKRDDRGEPVAVLVTSNDITERKRAEEALRRLNRELRAISSCNQTLMRATDEQSLLEEICQIVVQEAGYRLAFVAYAEYDEAKSVRPVAWTGAEEGYLATAGMTWADTERGGGPTGTAIRSGETCCVQDYETDPRVAPWRESTLQRGFRSGIALPLKDEHDKAFGSLTICSAQPNAFTAEEVRLLEELAGDMAFGIVTLRSRAARKQAEERLRESETYLAEAQKLSHTGSWAFDLGSNKYIYASEECFRIFGFEPQETLLTREVVFRRIHPDDAERVNRGFEKSVHEKVDSSDEFRIVLPDGAVKNVHVIRHPVLNSADDVVKLFGTAVDITERKRAEEEVRNNAAQWQATFDAVQDSVLLLDKDFRILRANHAAAEFLRLPFDKIVGGYCYDLTHGASTPPAECPLAKMLQSRRHEEAEVLARNGGPWLSVSVDPIFDPNGELTQVVHVARDITDRKRAEEALRESETRFRTFVDHAADALFVYDLEQRIVVDVNRSACESLGYTRQELIGKSPCAFHLDSYQAEIASIAGRALAGETVFDRHWHRRKDGSLFMVEVHTSLVLYGGRHFLLMVARDITDRLQAEEQRDKLRQLEADLAHINRVSMMGELTASIAHEVNQPLSGVVNNGSACLRWLAGDGPNLEEAREAARRIVRDGKRAGEVIARIRALTRRTEVCREKLDLNETIRAVLALVSDQAKKNRVMIRTQFADDLSPVSGDQVQLQQVVLNLVMNAIEAMSSVEDRARELVITTRNVDPDQVQVTVEDSGIGIDPQTIDKIFDSFYTTKPGGMGMGLSISRSILQAHGGRLWATAKDGKGTIFYFSLPKYHKEEANARVAV